MSSDSLSGNAELAMTNHETQVFFRVCFTEVELGEGEKELNERLVAEIWRFTGFCEAVVELPAFAQVKEDDVQVVQSCFFVD